MTVSYQRKKFAKWLKRWSDGVDRVERGDTQDGKKIPQVAEKCSFHCSPKQEHNNREIRRRRTREQERASFLHIRLDENRLHAATTSPLRSLKHAV